MYTYLDVDHTISYPILGYFDHKCTASPCSVRIQVGSGITPCSEAAASLAMHPLESVMFGGNHCKYIR